MWPIKDNDEAYETGVVDLSDDVVAASGGVVQRCSALGVSSVDVSLSEEQELRHGGAVVAAGQVQRSHSVLTLLHVHI